MAEALLNHLGQGRFRAFSAGSEGGPGPKPMALKVLNENHVRFGGGDISVDDTCAKVSIVGAGMQSHCGVAAGMFEALANNDINIKMISTSEIKVSVIISKADTDRAVSAIHDMLVSD